MISQARKKPEEEIPDLVDQTICKRFLIKQKVGQGAHGIVFTGRDITYDFPVAVKAMARHRRHKVKFQREVCILRELFKEYGQGKVGLVGFPQLYHYEVIKDCFVIVMEKLGLSLKEMREQVTKIFSLKNTITIGIALVQRLKAVHSLGFIHRDIKPANVLLGLGKNQNTVYLIDFGLSKKLHDNLASIEQSRINPEVKKLAGTPIYASINAHMAAGELQKKDDLESMMYLLVQLGTGSLPWQSIKPTKDDNFQDLMNCKIRITPQQLCKDLPPEFAEVLIYILTLEFGVDPDYKYIENLFRQAANNSGIEIDGVLNWEGPQIQYPQLLQQSQISKRSDIKSRSNNEAVFSASDYMKDFTSFNMNKSNLMSTPNNQSFHAHNQNDNLNQVSHKIIHSAIIHDESQDTLRQHNPTYQHQIDTDAQQMNLMLENGKKRISSVNRKKKRKNSKQQKQQKNYKHKHHKSQSKNVYLDVIQESGVDQREENKVSENKSYNDYSCSNVMGQSQEAYDFPMNDDQLYQKDMFQFEVIDEEKEVEKQKQIEEIQNTTPQAHQAHEEVKQDNILELSFCLQNNEDQQSLKKSYVSETDTFKYFMDKNSDEQLIEEKSRNHALKPVIKEIPSFTYHPNNIKSLSLCQRY